MAKHKKIPPTRFPDAVAVTYQRQLIKLVREMGKVTLRQFDATLKPYIKSYQADADELNLIQRTLDIIKALSLSIFRDERILDIALTFVNGLNLFNMKNMNDQARVIGVNPIDAEPWIDDYIQSSIQQNVGYIKSIESTFFDKISTIIYEGTKNGISTKEIRRQLVKQIGVSESKAQFIAVDQSGTIHGQLVAKRHQDMGVKKFKWSTSHDERVRKTHRELDGNTYSYSEPPSEGLPGTPYRCRCIAIPVFDDKTSSSNQSPSFLRVTASENNYSDDIKAIKEDLTMVPDNHRELLSAAVKEIRIVSKGASNYNRKTGVVSILEGMEKGELVHELGHAIETKLDFKNNDDYKELLNNVLKGKSLGDIYWNTEDYSIPIMLLKSGRFISEYQGYLYQSVGILDDEGNINYESLGEYFSEGYREFIMNPNNLKKHDKELYNFIKGLKM